MKKLNVLFLFVAIFLVMNVASADTASDWWGANCSDSATADEYGVRSPVVYANVYTGVGTAENLAQVGETFTFMVRGPLKYSAELSASDSGVALGAKTCLSNNQPYPNCGQNQFEFKQDVTISGEPRDIVIKTTDGGVLFPGKTGPSKPVCLKVPVYRGTHSYEYSIELDKTEFSSNEAFKITVGGISWLKAKDMGSQIQFARSNAPASSCEYGPIVGKENTICQGDGILTCSLLPDTSKPQYLCAATMLDTTGMVRFPNRDADVTYTVSLRDTQDLFDTYTFVGGAKTIKLLKQGSVGTTTDYGSCVSGEGVDPTKPQNGCTRCENIPNNYRRFIASCESVPLDKYYWRKSYISGFDGNAPICSTQQEGAECRGGLDGTCRIPAGANQAQFKLDCLKEETQVAQQPYRGKVVDISGKGIKDATVRAGHPTASYLGISCPQTLTNENGEYAFDLGTNNNKSLCFTLSGAWVDVKATGYVDARTPVGSEFDKKIKDTIMVRTGTPPMLPLSVDDSDQTMDGNTVRFVLRNAVPGKVEVCSQVINHPNLPNLNTPESTPCSSWISAGEWASGNEEWKFDASKSTLTGTFRADAKDVNGAPVWNIPGLVVRASFRIEGTTDVVTATLRVAGGPAPKATEPAPAPAGGGVLGGVGTAIAETAESAVVAVGEAFTSIGKFIGDTFAGLMSIF